jgi:hypothetical protein
VADEAQVKLLEENGVYAWNEWRKANPKTRPDLRKAILIEQELIGADFSCADLREADLGGAILVGANFIEADLRRSKLDNANLLGAMLRGANLRGSDLSMVSLVGVDLSGTSLGRADLGGADLTDADLTDCFIGETQLGDIDLSRCKGLEMVKHEAPSTIGIDTIYRSGGNIPEIFLRGAGIPEAFIVQMKSLVAAMSPIEFYSCFISYSHADKAFARKLHDSLQARGSAAGWTNISSCPAMTSTMKWIGAFGYGTRCCSAALSIPLPVGGLTTKLGRPLKKSSSL